MSSLQGSGMTGGEMRVEREPFRRETNPRLSVESFDFVRVLGRGKFGEVWLGRDRASGETVAIKEIRHDFDEKQLRSIRLEIQIHSSLNHPNIVGFRGSFVEGGSYFVVLEYCERGSVGDLLRGRRGLGVDQAREIMKDLCNAVEYLHSKSIVHRDIKPGNLLLDKEGRAKLCDFGLSTTVGRLGPDDRTICGTPNYISPEMIDRKTIALPTDIYSMGCLLYALLTGVSPNWRGSITDTYSCTRTGSYEIPSDMDQDAADLIRRMMEKEENRRLTIREVRNHPFMTGKGQQKVVPMRIPLESGMIEVVSDGSIRFEERKRGLSMIITEDKEEVEIKTGGRKNRWRVGELPREHRGMYRDTIRIVEEVGRRRILVIFHGSDGDYVLHGDGSVSRVIGGGLLKVEEGREKSKVDMMRGVARLVESSGDPQWPVVIGRKRR